MEKFDVFWWHYIHTCNDIIEIPQQLIGDKSNIFNEVYGSISENILSDNILNSVILAPKNDEFTLINTGILNQIPGEQRT